MINELIKLSNDLDNKGFKKEADYLDAVIKKMATERTVPHGGVPGFYDSDGNWHRGVQPPEPTLRTEYSASEFGSIGEATEELNLLLNDYYKCCGKNSPEYFDPELEGNEPVPFVPMLKKKNDSG